MAQQATDGGRKPRVTDQEILKVFREHRDPVLSTAEVADQLPIKRRGTLNRLRRLEEQGEVVSKQIGGRNTVWWLTGEPRAPSTPARDDIAASDLPAGGEGQRETAPSATNPGVETGETTSTVTETGESVPADFDELVRQVGEETLPGSGEKLEARQEAFTAVVEYLREQGSATPQNFREKVYPDHQAMYTDGKNPPRSWWKNAMYPALRELAERVTVIEQADTSGEWTWREVDR